MRQLSREVKMEGSFNFRDLGGYETTDGKRVKNGMLFRSGNLSRITETDKNRLREMGIKNICDLRDNDEVNKHPDPILEGVTWNHIPLIKDEEVVRQPGDLNQFETKLMNSKPGEMLLSLNREMISNTLEFRRIFQLLIDNPTEPMLFHCMAGKDRTGVVAALLLSLLRVPREVIEEDYLYTNNLLEEIERGFTAIGYILPSHIDREVVKAIYEARIDYIRAFFDEIEKKFGDVDIYLSQGIGLSEEEITLLRNHLLES
ncbi:tyrosine-protein phosphatase [Ornithinibacillus scapharcae]|uniref:tyrosine-protein phosphatase n=1 Tax=Ornithinibacillus scapharcae TaxID=1147159 RepID=UPI000225BBCC|nr:tyrosine-protein phosphatase [Ornithinibacillus scapharcae]